jgi:hypothetical protein
MFKAYHAQTHMVRLTDINRQLVDDAGLSELTTPKTKKRHK